MTLKTSKQKKVYEHEILCAWHVPLTLDQYIQAFSLFVGPYRVPWGLVKESMKEMFVLKRVKHVFGLMVFKIIASFFGPSKIFWALLVPTFSIISTLSHYC